MSGLRPPPRWSEEELAAASELGAANFRQERLQEPLEDYLDAFDDFRGVVEELLEQTVDLTRLVDQAVEVLTDPNLREAVRYLAGPPISLDDLKVLADAKSLAPQRLRADPEGARQIIETVLLALDRRRFPWVREDREPTEAEREAAALASAALAATRRLETRRRTVAKTLQEDLVAEVLREAGLVEVPAPRVVRTLGAGPGPGEFCRETIFGERKADLLVGLWDGRRMPLECKVSNSSLNSIKRLNNDAAVKAEVWLSDFGRTQVVPGAVLAGVYKVAHLQAVQERGLAIWWAHDLGALTSWIESTR